MPDTIKIDRLVRSRRRTLALEITGDAELIVRAPKHAPMNYIEGFIRRKQAWIRRKLDEAARKSRPVEKRFVAGEEFLYLGNAYKLEIVDNHIRGIELGDRLYMPRSLLSDARDALTKWYRSEARRIISPRVCVSIIAEGGVPARTIWAAIR